MVTARRAPAANRERPEPPVARKSSDVPVGLLIGLGVGVAGLFVLVVVGGGLLFWFLHSSSSPQAPTTPPTAVEVAQADVRQPALEPAQADVGQPALEPARPVGAVPPAVPEAPPAGKGGEEFVDLPERGEDLPGVAGLNPEPQPAPGQPPLNPQPQPGPGDPPAARPRVTLTNGLATRGSRRPGMFFQVDYRFDQNIPGVLRYDWVIITARGQAYKQTLVPAELRQQGTLRGRVLVGTSRLNLPYRTFLVAEMHVPGQAGLQTVKISDVLTIR